MPVILEMLYIIVLTICLLTAAALILKAWLLLLALTNAKCNCIKDAMALGPLKLCILIAITINS